MRIMNFEERVKDIKGTTGIYFKNLNTGRELAHQAETAFHPASIIKLPVFMAISRMAAEGRAGFDEKIKVTYEKRVPSCGAFNAFTDEPVVDVATLCNLMITISDNTAANILIDHYGIEPLNREFKDMGLAETHLERLFYDDEMQEKGYNNKAVPREIGMLLTQIYEGAFVNKDVSWRILNVLLNQQRRDKIPAHIELECPVGNKSGEARDITGDAAVVLGAHPFVLVIMANDTFVPQTDEVIRLLSRDILKEVKQGRL